MATFRHRELAELTDGRAQRMRERGAPRWLVEAEQNANRAGYTMRKLPGFGPIYYRVPLETDEEYVARRVEARDRRLCGEEPLRRMPDAGAYHKAMRGGGFTVDPDVWDSFEDGAR